MDEPYRQRSGATRRPAATVVPIHARQGQLRSAIRRHAPARAKLWAPLVSPHA